MIYLASFGAVMCLLLIAAEAALKLAARLRRQ